MTFIQVSNMGLFKENLEDLQAQTALAAASFSTTGAIPEGISQFSEAIFIHLVS